MCEDGSVGVHVGEVECACGDVNVGVSGVYCEDVSVIVGEGV